MAIREDGLEEVHEVGDHVLCWVAGFAEVRFEIFSKGGNPASPAFVTCEELCVAPI